MSSERQAVGCLFPSEYDDIIGTFYFSNLRCFLFFYVVVSLFLWRGLSVPPVMRVSESVMGDPDERAALLGAEREESDVRRLLSVPSRWRGAGSLFGLMGVLALAYLGLKRAPTSTQPMLDVASLEASDFTLVITGEYTTARAPGLHYPFVRSGRVVEPRRSTQLTLIGGSDKVSISACDWEFQSVSGQGGAYPVAGVDKFDAAQSHERAIMHPDRRSSSPLPDRTSSISP